MRYAGSSSNGSPPGTSSAATRSWAEPGSLVSFVALFLLVPCRSAARHPSRATRFRTRRMTQTHPHVGEPDSGIRLPPGHPPVGLLRMAPWRRVTHNRLRPDLGMGGSRHNRMAAAHAICGRTWWTQRPLRSPPATRWRDTPSPTGWARWGRGFGLVEPGVEDVDVRRVWERARRRPRPGTRYDGQVLHRCPPEGSGLAS